MQVGVIKSSTQYKTTGSSVGDGFIIMNNNTNMFLQSSDGDSAFCITPSNKIGFGTNNPQEQIDVSGSGGSIGGA